MGTRLNPIVELQTIKKETTILPFDAMKRKQKHFRWMGGKLNLVVVCNQKQGMAFKTCEVENPSCSL